MIMYTQILIHSLNSYKNNFFSAYPFDRTFFRFICLTAIALFRIAMRSLHAAQPYAAPLRGRLQRCKSAILPICLVVAIEPEKRTFNRAQLKVSNL